MQLTSEPSLFINDTQNQRLSLKPLWNQYTKVKAEFSKESIEVYHFEDGQCSRFSSSVFPVDHDAIVADQAVLDQVIEWLYKTHLKEVH